MSQPFLKRFLAAAAATLLLIAGAVITADRRQVAARSVTPAAEDPPELPASDGSSLTPEIEVEMVDKAKAKLKLSSLRGKVVLLDFFWTQCQHCREHAPHVVELYNQYRDRGFTVLGLATDGPQKAGDVKAFMRDTKINYPVGYISTELVAYYTDSHNHGVPQMVIFGTDGKMVKRLIGWNEQTNKDLLAALKSQLGDAPAAPAAKPVAGKAGVKTGGRAAQRPAPRG
jgi:thiol-disulfide isomerase/thioredoxin